MNPASRMGCFVICMDGIKRGKTRRKRDRKSEEACCAISPTPEGEMA
jgi:hypothetical protein